MKLNFIIPILKKLISKRLSLKEGIIEIKKIEITKGNCITFYNLSIITNIFTLEVEILNITIELKSIITIKKSELVKSIIIKNLKINAAKNKDKSKSNENNDANKPNSTTPYSSFYRLYLIFANTLYHYKGTISLDDTIININNHHLVIAEFTISNTSFKSAGRYHNKSFFIAGTKSSGLRQLTVSEISFENYLATTDNFSIELTETSKDMRLETIGINFKIISSQMTFHFKNNYKVSNIDIDVNFFLEKDVIKTLDPSGGVINDVPFILKFDCNRKKNLLKCYLYCKIDEGLRNALTDIYSSKLNQINFKNNISLRISFACAMDNIFLQKFMIESYDDNLKIIDYNALDLSLLSRPYPVNFNFVKKNKEFSAIHARISGIEYTPLNQIYEGLKKLIIITEDPDFHTHKGLDIPRIGLAIATNISEKKFKKGASTITMQLVRNLLLGHDKNVFRKIDELAIAIIMEQYLMIPKNSIYELYLNIIEFGPNIFGIHDACAFYFSKKPADLTLTEAILLTYIIPRPKHFYEALIADSAILQTNIKNHVLKFSELLELKEIFPSDEINAIASEIYFSEKLERKHLKLK